MARDASSAPAAAAPLPKVSFQIVDDPASTKPTGVHDHTARSYGFNDTSDFERPESYIRYIEPLEIDLAGQVEYDMDEQDKAWLDAVNLERRKEQLDQVSYETFEIAMDRLEKDWFDLTKNLPKPDFAMPSEDSTCAVCDDSEGENSNAIVFCDGCNLAVHQDCYGVPYIPEGQWLCRKCTVSPEHPVSCILCPNEGGAFKQTSNGEWVHLLCAIWVPETRVANEVFMEPVTGVDKIQKQRWKLNCSLCRIKEGACIQCSKASCFTAFHTTCARRERLLLPMKSAHGAEPVTLTCYCDKHLPKEQADARAAYLETNPPDSPTSPTSPTSGASPSDPIHTSPTNNKSARAYAKTYEPGPPLVPALLVSRLTQYCKEPKRKKVDFMLLLCRYWSLKREARRGAPLLKRLHLEPWTARGSGGGMAGQGGGASLEEREMKLQQLKKLLADMTQLQLLTTQVVERERVKLKQTREIVKVLDTSVLVFQEQLRAALEQLVNHDRKGYFKEPVNKLDVPDYFDIIKKPMCWSMIEVKLGRHQYWDVQAFKDDVNLLISNAILYNKPQTLVHKAVMRIQKAAGPIFEALEKEVAKGANGVGAVGVEPMQAQEGEEDAPHEPVEGMKMEDLLDVGADDGHMNQEIGQEPVEMEGTALDLAVAGDDAMQTSTPPAEGNPIPADQIPAAAAAPEERPSEPAENEDIQPGPRTPETFGDSHEPHVNGVEIEFRHSPQEANQHDAPDVNGMETGIHQTEAEVTSPTLGNDTSAQPLVSVDPEPLGDLEPPLELLTLLLDTPAISSEIYDIIIDDPPPAFLFKYAFAKEKPPPPPPTPPPPPPPKPKRDRKAENQKRRQRKEEEKARRERELEEILQTAEGTRASRTKTRAAAQVVQEPPPLPVVPEAAQEEASAQVVPEAEIQVPSPVESQPQPVPEIEEQATPIDVEGDQIEPAEAESPTPISAVTRKVRKPPPRVSDVPPLVDEVDNQKSFKMFHEGWILPPDQKRRSTKIPAIQPISARGRSGSVGRPRKKMRTDAGPSRLSVVSTAPSENQTQDGQEAMAVDWREPEQPPVTGSGTPAPIEQQPEYIAPPAISARIASRRLSQVVPPTPAHRPEVQVVHMENGTIVVEELDTPTIRKKKAHKRKEEKRLAALASAAVAAPAVEDSAEAMQGQEQVQMQEPQQQQEQLQEQLQSPPPPVLSHNPFLDSGYQAPPVRPPHSSSSQTPGVLPGPGFPGPETSAPAVYDPISAVPSTSVALPKKEKSRAVKSPRRNEDESELSELSDAVPQAKKIGRPKTGKKRGRKPRATMDAEAIRTLPVGPRPIRTAPLPNGPNDEPGSIKLAEGTMLEGGTLVWAKLFSFPWWPAVVFEEDDPRVPWNIYEGWLKAIRDKRDGTQPLHLVQFFDKQMSWQFLSLNRMKQLGENQALDNEMISSRQFKKAGQRQECLIAYERARLEMETASEGEGSKPTVHGGKRDDDDDDAAALAMEIQERVADVSSEVA